jgi:DNA-binding SARP family transcriptional activator
VNLDAIQQRDRRIADLEAIPARDRTAAQQQELGRLHNAQDKHWRRLPAALHRAQAKAAAIEAYARQIRMPIE